MPLPAQRRSNLPPQRATKPSALGATVCSVLLPGGGQLWQHRYGTATLQLGSFIAYTVATFRYGGGWWALGAFVVNVWSAVDAWWWARGSGEDDTDPQFLNSELRLVLRQVEHEGHLYQGAHRSAANLGRIEFHVGQRAGDRLREPIVGRP